MRKKGDYKKKRNGTKNAERERRKEERKQRRNIVEEEKDVNKMWSAIPVSLLCMIINFSRGSRAAPRKIEEDKVL